MNVIPFCQKNCCIHTTTKASKMLIFLQVELCQMNQHIIQLNLWTCSVDVTYITVHDNTYSYHIKECQHTLYSPTTIGYNSYDFDITIRIATGTLHTQPCMWKIIVSFNIRAHRRVQRLITTWAALVVHLLHVFHYLKNHHLFFHYC